MKLNAFTLIELLVVIAIIAILASILFPVFAQAKLAAKKTAALSGVKQLNLGVLLYVGDFDDTYPLQQGHTAKFGWLSRLYVRIPAGWGAPSTADPDDPDFNQANNFAWANSMQLYIKSRDLLHAPGETVRQRSGYDDYYAHPLATPQWANLQYNGLLTEYSATAIAAPSKLISFWQGWGARTYLGLATANPVLLCYKQKDQPCRYVPTNDQCSEDRNGEWSQYNVDDVDDGPAVGVPQTSLWMYGKGANAAMADGSAKFRRMGMNVNGDTDYRTDPYTDYDRNGVPSAGWNDDAYCHPLLFRPDFDFENFGVPIKG